MVSWDIIVVWAQLPLHRLHHGPYISLSMTKPKNISVRPTEVRAGHATSWCTSCGSRDLACSQNTVIPRVALLLFI